MTPGYNDEDAEDVPFLSSKWSSPLPPLTLRFEGNNKSVCILEFLDLPENVSKRETKRREKRMSRLAEFRGWNDWVLRLFNACAVSGIILNTY